jgi:hypothetical protein
MSRYKVLLIYYLIMTHMVEKLKWLLINISYTLSCVDDHLE